MLYSNKVFNLLLQFKLENKINVQFNTRKQMVLQLMADLIENNGALDDINSFSLFGTNSFNLVWEKVCAEVLENQLHTPINALGLDAVNIPDGAKYSDCDELIDIIEKPKWQGYAKDKSEFIKETTETLTPDLISIYRHDTACDFVIFDAKYYTIQLEREKELRGQPGVNDVIKQYLYQLAYKDFVNKNNFNCVKNCFLMPTEKEPADGVIKKGSVKMDMLEALDLEQIQVRQLSARQIFKDYLSGMKVDIGKLDL